MRSVYGFLVLYVEMTGIVKTDWNKTAAQFLGNLITAHCFEGEF